MTTDLTEAMTLLPFDDERVQLVYHLLCDDQQPPDSSKHWEGWTAQRIATALLAQERKRAERAEAERDAAFALLRVCKDSVHPDTKIVIEALIP